MATHKVLASLLSLGFLAIGGGQMSHADKANRSELDVKISTIAARVSEIRGLKIKKPIVKGVMNQKQLKDRLLLRIHEDYTAEEIASEEIMMKRFGFFPENKKYLDTVVSMLTEQIAGFYDPKEGKLYVTQSTGMGEDVVLSHEIEHAIQDQHFDLQKFMTEKKDIGDESLARQALLEGDGTLLMFEFSGTLDYSKKERPNAEMMAQSFSAATIQMASYPMALRESMIFPYQAGLRFVDYFRFKGGWTLMDEVYKKPPVSTEQILHPEKYEEDDKPIAVSINKPEDFKNWHEVSSNVAGEFSIALMLRGWGVERQDAERAAAGWGGDKIVVWARNKKETNSSQTIGLLKSVWDDENEASEFFEVAKEGLESWSSALAFKQAPNHYRFKDREKGQVYGLKKDGKNVLLVLGAPPAWEEVILKKL